MGDLAEEYVERSARNRLGAWIWYLGQVLTIDTRALNRAAGSLNGRWARDHGVPAAQGITSGRVLDMLLQDIRYAIRRLLKSPAFTLVAVLSLGLGIGANSALFTMVNALFLQDDGIREPDRVVQIYWNGQNPYWSISWNWYRGMRDDLSESFSNVTAYRLMPARTEATGDRLVSAIYASGDYFGTMGVSPLMGRGFEPGVETDIENGPPVVVLTHDFWTRAMGSDPNVIGSTMRIEATPHTVVGVLPPSFSGKASESRSNCSSRTTRPLETRAPTT